MAKVFSVQKALLESSFGDGEKEEEEE